LSLAIRRGTKWAAINVFELPRTTTLADIKKMYAGSFASNADTFLMYYGNCRCPQSSPTNPISYTCPQSLLCAPIQCPAGKYATFPRGLTCVNCPLGSFCTGGVPPSSITPCPAHSYCAGGAKAPTACFSGMYAPPAWPNCLGCDSNKGAAESWPSCAGAGPSCSDNSPLSKTGIMNPSTQFCYTNPSRVGGGEACPAGFTRSGWCNADIFAGTTRNKCFRNTFMSQCSIKPA
jgi:hypothetical protein